ncbi:MAG: hypothetical protein M0R03_16830 [Novosphingobium sp.]|nr:hypothetical protein [Novosphingobium sp.]
MIDKITSQHLKVALMHYYRYTRQFICCDEVKSFGREKADILVDTGKFFIEIEIKTSKSDLSQEKHKSKHRKNELGITKIENSKCATYFYLCVPKELKDYTEIWIEEVNPKYGLITFNSERFLKDIENKRFFHWELYLWNCRRAKN